MLPERVAYARDLCARWVEDGHTPTLGVCVARRGVVVLHEAFGVLGPGADSPPLTRDALFSVSCGGAMLWVDREHELVGAYFEVMRRMTASYDYLWNFDLFQNVITAAVVD